MYEILEKRELGPAMTLFRVRAPRVTRRAQPGQFIILRAHEEGERIPITIADVDRAAASVTIVVQALGKSTTQLCRMGVGDLLPDVVGPLGVPTHIERWGTVVCAGGGFGVAALHPIARAMKEAGNDVVSIIGARRRDLVLLEEEMRRASTRVEVATDDGSYGHRGLVTDVLKMLMDQGLRVDRVIAIGPVPMMRAVCALTREPKIPTIVSLNPIMVDGTGMCGACRVTVGGAIRFACVDGPDFDGHEVDFDELTLRQKAYLREERCSLEAYLEAGRG